MKTNKIPTAEGLFDKLYSQDGDCPEWAKRLAIEFAKLHTNAALEAAADLCIIDEIKREEPYCKRPYWEYTVNKDSIINAYPENLIE